MATTLALVWELTQLIFWLTLIPVTIAASAAAVAAPPVLVYQALRHMSERGER